MNPGPTSVTSALQALIREAILRDGGWLPFDRFMALALYAPGLGYYANASRKFGAMPASGSDFVTAPELTPLFGQALARQVAQALEHSRTDQVWEFGAGSGALAAQLLEALGPRVRRYTIVDLSGSLRERQRERLAGFGARVEWAEQLPERMRGVIVGNEVLDAMPVKLLQRRAGQWHERGVAWRDGGFAYQDRPTPLRPPVAIDGAHDYLTEIHPQAQAFVRTLADRLEAGAAFFLDYGFPEREYWHPQRHMGTLMCHRGHLADADPLADVGQKDITAHVDFTGIAVAAQEAGLAVLGYVTQARFLFNCGVLELAAGASVRERAAVQKLVNEHEMGELFKVIGLARGGWWDALGFAEGDRTERL
ncbi:MAG TPA: SAM-dependent methyltransferase [Ramlibacter sp.]|nr:SAM-dependent methyltransferase [Ramlibacter sp.]